MASKPLSYRKAFQMFVDEGKPHNADEQIIKGWKPNTDLIGKWHRDSTVFIIDVVLYDRVIASLAPDGVRLNSQGWKTNATKNRMNDVLEPLGWILREIEHVWKILPIPNDEQFLSRDFVDGMMVVDLHKSRDEFDLNSSEEDGTLGTRNTD
jgi:hypothetical protein